MHARSHALAKLAATAVAALVVLGAPAHARAQGSDDGWNAFLDALTAAGRTVRDNTPEGDGPVRAEGRVIHAGKQIGTADGKLYDAEGRLYAHASTTCLIFTV